MGWHDWQIDARGNSTNIISLKTKRNRKMMMHFIQEADIAITDLTVTSERIEAIDFSPSIMELGKNIFQF